MRLSVVVTIVDGGDALERCLAALAAQDDPPNLEIIVPWDDSVAAVAALAGRHGKCRFLPLGTIITEHPRTSAAGRHELYDRRRAAGLAAATGEIVGVLEDRGVPRRDWARTMVALHERLPHAAIGGAIENGRRSLALWAVYFCDFGRFQRPFEAGPRQWVSDINIGYKRRALDLTRDLWRDRYHETTVHWALQRAGETLYLSPDLIVEQMRVPSPFGALIAERVAWGRLFAHTRVRNSGLEERLWRTLLTPLLPVALFARLTRLQFAKRVTLGTFLKAAPAVLVLLIAWSLGEGIGYVTGKA
jgi:hypothetical protein